MTPVELAEQRVEDLVAAAGKLALAARTASLEALERRAAVLARLVEGHTPTDKDLAAVTAAEDRPKLLASLRESLRVEEAEARLRLAEAKVAATEEMILEAGAAVRRIHEAHAAALAPLLESEGGNIHAQIETPALTAARQRLVDLEGTLAAQRDELTRRENELAVYVENDARRRRMEARL